MTFSKRGPCNKEEMEAAIAYAKVVVREYEGNRADIEKQYQVARAFLTAITASAIAVSKRHILGEGYPWYQGDSVELLSQPASTFTKDSTPVIGMERKARVSNNTKVRLVLEVVDGDLAPVYVVGGPSRRACDQQRAK